MEIDLVLCKVRTNAVKNLNDLKMKIKTVLCEVSNGAEGRCRRNLITELTSAAVINCAHIEHL
jgi:hypothetical protein